MTFLALDKPARPTGLHISADTILIDTLNQSTNNQDAAAGWYGSSAAQDTLTVQIDRPLSAAANYGFSMSPKGPFSSLSPKGKTSPCPSPKPTQSAAAVAQLKGLQRTPLPLILARMKVLLERLDMLKEEGSCTSATAAQNPTAPAQAATTAYRPGTPKSPAAAHGAGAAATAGRSTGALFLQETTNSRPSTATTLMQHSNRPSTCPPGSRQNPAAVSTGAGQPGRPATATSTLDAALQARSSTGYRGSSTGYRGSTDYRSSTGARSSSGGAKPRKLIEVSTTGALGQTIMQQSAQSVLEELDVTLGFISQFLADLPPDTRKALATMARLENYKKDQLIFDIGDEPSHFYVILSGRIDIWSRPPGVYKPKSIVSVLRRGDAFGDQAIINGEPHGTAASPATNVTLLVVTRQDFMTVLGSHFLDVAAEWQNFLLTSVAPLADCDPAMVRRLCSMLVSEKPADGQECSMHEDQVCFIQSGNFELRLVDLQAQQAAEAALAAAIASTSSALPIAPIPENLRLAPGGMHVSRNTIKKARPASAPPGAQRPAAASTATAAAATSAAAAGAAGAAAVERNSIGSHGTAAAAVEVPAPASAASVIAGLGMLQAGLADCPALGKEGVLASVRVKGGRLVGTQGLAKALRKRHSTRVPYKVLAELGPGSWFGGGEALYGSGPLQTALQVVAVGEDCAVVHAHLSGLEKHGGPTLIKRLRDDAAFKLTYYLGRIGVLPPHGMAIGHPDSTLVSEAAALAAAAALETVGLTARGPGAGAVAAGAGAGAVSAGSGSGFVQTFGAGASGAAKHRPGSARSCSAGSGSAHPQAAVGVSPGAIAAGAEAGASSRPASAAKKKLGAKKGQGSLRRSSSGGISSAWDDAQIGVMPLSGEVVASATAHAQDMSAETAAAGGEHAPAGGPDCTSLAITNPFCPKATRARQKRVHVPGSGVFGPGVMAALQHIKAIHAADAAAVSSHDMHVSSSSSSGSLCAFSIDQSTPSATAQAMQAARVGGGPDGPAVKAGLPATRASTFQPAGAAAGSILSGSAAAAATSSSSKKGAYSDGFRVRPRSACPRTGTAADVYWQQPEHSATATGAALSGLLPTLFTDGLQPLIIELDCLLSRAGRSQHIPLLLQQQQHAQASSILQLQQQRWDASSQQQQDWQQPVRPASAAARLQKAISSGLDKPSKTVQWGRHQTVQQPQAQLPQRYSGGQLQHQQQQLLYADVLRHKPTTSLLAASVMWQRGSEAAFRPPLRQVLTSDEIARQQNAGVDALD